ncbi:hypothetical protein K9L67_02200 [Candidatus Woesearchaeota archaeon]|nr:hypothetical protein [Candidatus Woesearchaeota archaeon]MCF7901016.1 hypothetical protein [Candidatus Woesearchaeota archaeon]MCF8013403.1 hypothetical protein [Candidatus Woesearchaeota archaeon]
MISSKIKYYLFYPNNRKIIFKNLMIFLGSNILVGLFFGFKEYSQKATIYLYAGIFFAVVSLFFYILRIYYKKNIGYKRRAHEIALSVETKFIISYVLSIFMMTFYDVLILMNILF